MVKYLMIMLVIGALVHQKRQNKVTSHGYTFPQHNRIEREQEHGEYLSTVAVERGHPITCLAS
jgi:hypothetical protein